MARLPLVDPDDEIADPAVREMLTAMGAARGGNIPNVMRAVANHPEALEAMVGFSNVVYSRNSLTPPQRQFAYLTASVVNECHY